MAEAPDANVAIVQVTVVVPLQLNAGPLFCCIETKVVVAGSVSLSVTFVASLGPAFDAVIVYAMSVPTVASAGPVFVTERSAF